MKKYTYGNPSAANVLVQMVDDHDLSVIESEVSLIRELSGMDFFLIAYKVEDWNRDLSPWPAPAVFGKADFDGGAETILPEVLEDLGLAGRDECLTLLSELYLLFMDTLFSSLDFHGVRHQSFLHSTFTGVPPPTT